MRNRLLSLVRNNQRGDTIIEVIICMGIVSLVLSGAFVTTNESTLAVVNAQEHGEALKLAESELEQIRGNASGANPTVFAFVGPFCMYNETAVSTSGPTAVDCVQNSSGAQATAQPEFTITINQSSSINNGYIFDINVSWAKAQGTENGSESLLYRIYQ